MQQKQFHTWLKSLIRIGDDSNNYIHWKKDEIEEHAYGPEYVGWVYLYTRAHRYQITCRVLEGEEQFQGYLGCQVSARKPLAGETHLRGNDLADGYFTNATWSKIVIDILRYELVKIVKSARGKS